MTPAQPTQGQTPDAAPQKLLHDRVALVTGAGKGIGRAVATLFGRHGASVVLVARTEADVVSASEEITAAGGRALPMPGDLTDDAFVERLFQKVREEFGRLDILVNNAGTALGSPVETQTIEALRGCLELNVVAAFACMQQAIRLMKETNHDSGKIVNVGSVRSHWTESGSGGAYNASKYAVRALTESVARQLHGTGSRIAVGLLCPGAVDTPLTNPKGEPRPQWLRPETVAEAVLYMVTTPAMVNVFDLTLFSTEQKPW